MIPGIILNITFINIINGSNILLHHDNKLRTQKGKKNIKIEKNNFINQIMLI